MFPPHSLGGSGARDPRQNRTVLAPVSRRLSFLHISLFFIFWVAVICARLVWLQVVDHSKYMEEAARQQERTIAVAPRRGYLYDRNLHALAMTVEATSVYAVPIEIASKDDPRADEKYRAVGGTLARIVHTDPHDRYTSARWIAARLRASRNFAWIARRLDAKTIARIKALRIQGIYYQKEYKRYYPNQQLAAQVLGYVGAEGNGLGGLEFEYNDALRGTPGRELLAIDARSHVLGSRERDPQPGKNLVLTIDQNIQFIAEHALDEVMKSRRPLDAIAVVQDPNTGQILALAMRPTFNPNDYIDATPLERRDLAVSDVYEPGSTFKLVTYSAALNQGVTNPGQIINCQGGKIDLAGRIIHDDHPNYLLTTAQALWKSSDVAAIKLALRLGPDTFYHYIRAYGFGSRTGIELPGETRGLLRPPNRWQASSIGSIAIGQEVAVTPIQLISMVSAIANGGTYLPPHIVMDETGETPGNGLKPDPFHPEMNIPNPLPPGAHRVISSETSATMRKLLEGVVLYGTGRPAQLDGYSAGGKTGTAQKIDVLTHRYSKTHYIASFVGFAPVNDPAVTVMVVVDSPHGDYYGTSAAAPVFKEIMQQTLEYLGVPHDEPLEPTTPPLNEAEQVTPPPPEPDSDLDSLFAAANDLPEDDPLRSMLSTGLATGSKPSNEQTSDDASGEATQAVRQPAQEAEPHPHLIAKDRVIVSARGGVAVPSFIGQPLRQAIESAGRARLRLDIVGSGIAREQAPPAGATVPAGTRVVVRFTR